MPTELLKEAAAQLEVQSLAETPLVLQLEQHSLTGVMAAAAEEATAVVQRQGGAARGCPTRLPTAPPLLPTRRRRALREPQAVKAMLLWHFPPL